MVGLRGLEAAALVDRDIDQHRARPHRFTMSRRDQLRRRGAGHQHGADHEIGAGTLALDRVDGRIDRVQLRAELQVELIQPRQRAVDDRDMRLQAHGHARGVGADHAAAEDDDLRRPARPARRRAACREPPCSFSRQCAPTWIDMRPATSLIGASSGRPPRASVTVS